MKELVDWLAGVEQLAGDFYRESAVVFQEDAALSAFLRRLSEDEAEHHEIMVLLAQDLAALDVPVQSAVVVDPATRSRVETPLKEARDLISDRRLSKKELVERMVATEFSELNDVFLYALTAAGKLTKTAQYMAAAMQAHVDRIERFVMTLPDDLQPKDGLGRFPVVSQRKLLLVEDDAYVLPLLQSFLRANAAVETAENGEIALAKTRETFFDLIVSDIDMPVMDGIEFYRQVVAADPKMRRRFLFCSGALSPERRAFLSRNGLRCLSKPFDLDVLAQAVEEGIRGASEQF